MASFLVCFILIVSLGFYPGTFISAQITTLTNVDDELANIVDVYFDKQAVVPVQTVGSVMAVTVDLDLVSIVGFDDDTGSATISGYLTVKWTEERYTPVADDIDVSMSVSSIWTPPLLIVNSMMSVAAIGSDDDIVKLNLNSAQVVWKPRIYTKIKCGSNAFFPFDKQVCSVKVSSRSLDETEMTVAVTQSNIGTSQLIENALWKYKQSSATSYSVNSYPYVDFKFSIQRKSQYITFIVVSPVILISIVHLFVFLLPRDAEKLNYSITSMLGVLLVTLWAITYIPINADPVSAIIYFIFTEFLLNIIVVVFATNVFKEFIVCRFNACFGSLVPKQRDSRRTSRKNGVITPEIGHEPVTPRDVRVSSVNTAWGDVDDVDTEEDIRVKDDSSEKKTTNKPPDRASQLMSPTFMFLLFLCLHLLFTIAFFVSLGIV